MATVAGVVEHSHLVVVVGAATALSESGVVGTDS